MSNFCPAGWWLFRNDYHVCGGIVRGFGSSAEYFIGVVSFSAHCSLPLSNPSYLTTALILAPRWSSLTHSVSLVWFLIKREHCFGINIFRCSQGPDTVHYKWATINYSSQSDTVPGVPGVVIPRGSTRSSRRTWRCVKFLLEASTRNLRTQFPVLAGDVRFFSHCNFSPLLRLKPSDVRCAMWFISARMKRFRSSSTSSSSSLHNGGAQYVPAESVFSANSVINAACGFIFWDTTCPTGGKFLTWLEEDKQSNKTHSHDTD